MNRPPRYKFWIQSARDRYDERIALMLEGNGLVMNGEIPWQFIKTASDEAQAEHDLAKGNQC